jgi:hypothetical protein
MKISNLLRLAFGATLAIVTGCSSVDDPADHAVAPDQTTAASQSSQIHDDDSAAQGDFAATPDLVCPGTPRSRCLSLDQCLAFDGAPTTATCPTGKVCCHLQPNQGFESGI